MIISLDSALGVVFTKIGNINLAYNASRKLKEIISITSYDNGFLTMETNNGEEYTDYIELVKLGCFSDKYKEQLINKLEQIRLDDIVIKNK